MLKAIPHIITLSNLFCGCCALLAVFHQQYVAVFFFLLIAGLADYGDGLVARWLNVKSELGKELDSLADMVSFGLVPGAILYELLKRGFSLTFQDEIVVVALPAFLITLSSALRLAKYNLDTRQSESFIGLNTPSCTMFVVGLMLIYHFDSYGLGNWVIQPAFLYPAILVLSYLLIAEIPMFSFKFKNFKWAGNEARFIFLGLSLILLPLLQEVTFSLMIVLYVLFSLFMRIKKG